MNLFSQITESIQLKKSDFLGITEGIVIAGTIAFLFYRSYWGMLSAIVIVPFWLHKYRFTKKSKLNAKKTVEFKELMQLVGASLQAGYSIEHAFKQSEKEMQNLFVEDYVIREGLHRLNGKIAINIPAEKAFAEFAEEIGMEEAMTLSDILGYAKRSGGDYAKHIKMASIKIEEKLSVQQEIDTLTAEKRLELNIMSVMPIGILAYISISSSEFVAPLYGNLTGVIVMTVCLLVYCCMLLLGEKIVHIEV